MNQRRHPLSSWLLLSLICLVTHAGMAAVPLFDGKTLDGWEGNTEKVWRVEEGAIVGGSMEGNPQNEFLVWKKPCRDFVLKFEYKLVGTEGFVNGGVQFRSKRIAQPPNEMIGYQADIGAGKTGNLYDESRRKVTLVESDKEVVTKLEKIGGWNQYEIRCQGNRIQLSVNGTRTVDYTETDASIDREGFIALQIHGNCKAVISYRKLMFEDLAPATAMDASEPMKRLGSTEAAQASHAPFADGRFKMEPGEVVVFTGQENLVRDAKSGALESLLAARYATEAPRFRSMAWEADTVYEQWRDMNFGTWKDQLSATGATMVLAQFGQMEVLDGLKRLPEFTAAYHRLLDEFSTQTRKLVLIGPMPFERSLSPNAPDLTTKNTDVRAYSEAVQAIAKQRGAVFVDVFTPLLYRPASEPRLTDDGIHLNPNGQRIVASLIAEKLGVEPSSASPRESLREAIAEKNELWSDLWRPANWSFAFGDRVQHPFGKPGGGRPFLKDEMASLMPMVEQAEARIHLLASGKEAPALQLVQPVLPPEEKVMTPEEELATFTLAEGYECRLFASEKDGVIKPTQMSWDEKGRLYVACSPTYPHVEPGKKPGDYILVCEDTDGDGRVDKTSRFAEGLKMVQGVEPGAGGLYVCDYSELVHLRDRDGDGRADERRVIYSGFGIGDTHQLINSIIHGPEGSLWFSQGLHNFATVETAEGNKRLHKAGLWRLNTRTDRLDPFFNGAAAGANCWGVAFDDYGQVFHKSGDRPMGYYSVPGLIRIENPDNYHPTGALFDTNPKTTAIEFIGTKALPENVQGCAVIAGFMGNTMEFHRVLDDGSGFKSEQLPKLLKSTSTAFRPVDVSMGPDGAIYVCDWFNPIIGHYQASYRDPARDKTHGRIWRISAKGIAPVKQPALSTMKPAELLDQLRSPERWTRYQAKRLLFDANKEEALKAADAWMAKLDVADALYEHLLLEVIGIYQAHESPRPELLAKLIAAKDPKVRAYGARVVGVWSGQLPQALDQLRALVRDAHPRVRLESIVACSYVNQPQAVEVAALALQSPTDRFIDYALAQCVRGTKAVWKPSADKLTFGGDATIKAKIMKLAGSEPAPASPGKLVFDALCMNCHQPDGKGLPGIYPSVIGSDWVSGDKDVLIKILVHGLNGPIKINGQPFAAMVPMPMPPSSLNDEQIADVLSYLRSNFGNKAEAVTKEEVKTVREANKDRTAMWTADELKK